jgi:hypothetical protein
MYSLYGTLMVEIACIALVAIVCIMRPRKINAQLHQREGEFKGTVSIDATRHTKGKRRRDR